MLGNKKLDTFIKRKAVNCQYLKSNLIGSSMFVSPIKDNQAVSKRVRRMRERLISREVK